MAASWSERSELPVRLGGLPTSMTLAPFVYHVGARPPALRPNIEVAEAYWAPVLHELGGLAVHQGGVNPRKNPQPHLR